MKSTAEVVKVKEAVAWIENERGSDTGHIALQATTREGKPIHLSAAQTRSLGERLIKLADGLDSLIEQARARDDAEEG